MTNILFTCAGRRNYLLNYFREQLDDSDRIIAADMQTSAPALAYADKAIVLPPVTANAYIDKLLTICEQESVNALFSLNDLELPLLSTNRAAFFSKGVKLMVSDQYVIEKSFDKWKTKLFADQINLLVPETYLDLKTAQDAIKQGGLRFPLVVKPRWGSASIGLESAENMKELELSYELLRLKLFRSSLAGPSMADREHAILIQEKIEGTEFGIDILNDLDGRPRQVYIKEKISMRAGETDKAVLRDNPEIEAMGYLIGEKLRHIGNLDVDIFERDGKYYLLEMNPRFGGGYPFSHMSGANYPEAIIAWIKGKSYDFCKFRKNYNQVYAKYDSLMPVYSEF